jgi:outer membrane protein TolC
MPGVAQFFESHSLKVRVAGAFLCLVSAALAEPADTVSGGAGSETYRIDLPAVLQLAGAQNLDIQVAREKMAAARALHQSALLQFFPWLTVGASYSRHDGQIQATEGEIVTVSRQAYAPGATLTGQWELGEAIYRKLAAKQVERAAHFALEAQRQASITASAQGYFDLVLAQAAVGVAKEAVRIATGYEAQVQSAVEAGIAFKGDALRVAVQAQRNRLALRQAAEQQRVTAARLAETLHLDPSIDLVARDADLTPLELIEPDASLESLVQQALVAAPELKQSQSLLEAAHQNRNGAVYGPWVPSLGAAAYLGGFGGGRNGDTGDFADREDYFIGLGWRIGRGGLFDVPRQRAAEAHLSSATHSLDKTRDQIVRRVVEAFTRLQSQSEQIATAGSGLAAAEEGLSLAQQRQEFGVGIVLENILAEQDLTRARNDYLGLIAEFNKAQYALLDAIGTLPVSP